MIYHCSSTVFVVAGNLPEIPGILDNKQSSEAGNKRDDEETSLLEVVGSYR